MDKTNLPEPVGFHDYRHGIKVVLDGEVPNEHDWASRMTVEDEVMTEHFGSDSLKWPRYYFPHWIRPNILKIYWTNDDEERLITTKYSYSDPDDENTKHLDVIWQAYEPGRMLVMDASAPGSGHQTYKVTRKDDTGLWGICTEDTMWVPNGGFYR